MQSEQINELAAALAKAQGAMANAVMNRTNPHFKSKYADLASVLDSIRAPLSANGIAITQTMEIGERYLILRTTLLHSSGQFIATEYPIALALKPQEMGSALTYARRYSIAALVCNSADEDDDGEAAMSAKPAKPVNGSARISIAELAQLRELIDIKEADVPKLCNYFKISSLADITTDILPNVLAALEAKKAQPHA